MTSSGGPGDLPSDVTTRRCEGCGEVYSPADAAAKHATCSSKRLAAPATDKTVAFMEMKSVAPLSSAASEATLPAPKSRPSTGDPESDTPPEVLEAMKNPRNIINQYVSVKQLGKGGMGTVLKAFDRTLLRWVAIKFLHVDDEESIKRFRREAQLAARLRHPNIAPIYEVGQCQEQHFLAMEFIDGSSLDKLKIPVREMIELFMKVCAGVEAAHKGGVVHRDLKPQNVMVTQEGWPYVMDFGLAKALTGSSLSISGSVMGTPAYMPPEQAGGKLDQIDARSDVYSLGATLYALLTRKQPFDGQTAMDILMKVCNTEPEPPRKHNPEIPETVERIILKAMAKEKNDRYPSAAALGEDLKRHLAGSEVAAKGPSSMLVLARKAKRNLWPIIAGTAVLVAVAVVAIVLASKPKPDGGAASKNGSGGTATDGSRDDEWLTEFLNLRSRIAVRTWAPNDASATKEAQQHVAQVPDSKVTDVERWLRDNLEDAGDILVKEPVKAPHIGAWARMIQDTVEPAPRLADVKALARSIQDQAAARASDRGTFKLIIAPSPFARISKATRDGQELALPGRDTPLVLSNLPVGDYVFEFTHPSQKGSSCPIAAGQLERDRTYRIYGPVGDPKFKAAP